MKTVWLPAMMFFLMAGAAFSVDEPKLKEGLWSIHTESIDQPGNKKTTSDRSLCRSHEYDARIEQMGKDAAAKCKTIHESTSGGKRDAELECTVAGTVIHTKAATTLTGDTAAHSETHTTYTPPVAGMAEAAMIMDQKYVGACPAGMDPGDSMSADGKIVKGRKR